MTDASYSSQEQSQQTNIQMPTTSSHASDGTKQPQQSEVKGLDNLFAELEAITKKRNGSVQRARIRQSWYTHHFATFAAKYHRKVAGIHTQAMNLDTATARHISHLQKMSKREKQALDAYHAILKVMRTRMTVLAEVEEASRKILALTDETPDGIYLAREAQFALKAVQKERRDMVDFLKSLRIT